MMRNSKRKKGMLIMTRIKKMTSFAIVLSQRNTFENGIE